VQVAAEDAAVGSDLGWTAGGVPGAEVRIEREGAVTSRQTGQTDSGGVVRFAGILTGRYRVSTVRLLSVQEQGALDASRADVNALGGGGTVEATAPATDTALVASAGTRGSVTISEWSFYIPIFPGGLQYPFGGFVELYNNADTTVYLDGMIFGAGFEDTFDYPNWPCRAYEPLRNDPAGIWTQYVYLFPGSGRDHPVAPGQVVVVATDAIDHGAVVPGGLDLRGADFEWVGGADVDNPVAANMIDVGSRAFTLFGHGYFSFETDAVPFIAEPLDVNALPSARDPFTGWEFRRVPGDRLMDVAAFRVDGSSFTTLVPCPQMVNVNFDRQELVYSVANPEGRHSLQRRVLAVLSDGRKILQRTRTSARDFESREPRTPGWIP
jgi:hypothetical protein